MGAGDLRRAGRYSTQLAYAARVSLRFVLPGRRAARRCQRSRVRARSGDDNTDRTKRQSRGASSPVVFQCLRGVSSGITPALVTGDRIGMLVRLRRSAANSDRRAATTQASILARSPAARTATRGWCRTYRLTQPRLRSRRSLFGTCLPHVFPACITAATSTLAVVAWCARSARGHSGTQPMLRSLCLPLIKFNWRSSYVAEKLFCGLTVDVRPDRC